MANRGNDKTAQQLEPLNKIGLQPDPHPLRMQRQRLSSGLGRAERSASIALPVVTASRQSSTDALPPRSALPLMATMGTVRRANSSANSSSGKMRDLMSRLEEAEMLLVAKGEVNRGLDGDVHKLMGQLEELNRRYAALGRRTSGLQDELATSASSDYKALRLRLQRAEDANTDLEQVAREKVESMRAERDAFEKQLLAAETEAEAGGAGTVSHLQAELSSAQAAEASAREALAEEARTASRQAAAQSDAMSRLRRVEAEKAHISEQLAESEVALKASRVEAAAAMAEAAQLADQIEDAEKRAVAAQEDLQAHMVHMAGGDADVEAMFQQLQAAQSSAATVSAESAELRSEVRAVNRERRSAETRVSELEADLKSVLAKLTREVESATSARREAAQASAARQTAEAERQRAFVIVRGFEEEREQLQDDVTALQKSSAAKNVELQRMTREVAEAQDDRHSALQQVARLEGQNASLESEAATVAQETVEIAEKLTRALSDTRIAQQDAQAAIMQVQLLRDRLAESDSGTHELATAAREADQRCEELMSQLQQARGQASASRREAAALTEQVATLEAQVVDVEALLGRQSGDVVAGGADGKEWGRSDEGDTEYQSTSDEGPATSADASRSTTGSSHPLADDEGNDRGALPYSLLPAVVKSVQPAAAAAAVDEGPPSDIWEVAPALPMPPLPAGSTSYQSAAAALQERSTSEASDSDVAAMADDSSQSSAQHPERALHDEPSRTDRRDWDECATSQRIESLEAEGERLKKQVELQRQQLMQRHRLEDEAAEAAAEARGGASGGVALRGIRRSSDIVASISTRGDSMDGGDSPDGLAAARKRILQLEQQLHAATEQAAEKARRKAAGGWGWEELLDVPEEQRGAPPTTEQLAMLQEQMQKLLVEREEAEQQLSGLASQMDSRVGADAAEAGNVSSLKRYWRHNERLQSDKALIEEKLRKMAAVPGIGMPRLAPATDTLPASALTTVSSTASLARAEECARQATAERDHLQRRLEEVLSSQATLERGVSGLQHSELCSPVTKDDQPRDEQFPGATSLLRQLQADLNAAKDRERQLQEDNKRLQNEVRQSVGAHGGNGPQPFDEAQEVERLRDEVTTLKLALEQYRYGDASSRALRQLPPVYDAAACSSDGMLEDTSGDSAAEREADLAEKVRQLASQLVVAQAAIPSSASGGPFDWQQQMPHQHLLTEGTSEEEQQARGQHQQQLEALQQSNQRLQQQLAAAHVAIEAVASVVPCPQQQRQQGDEGEARGTWQQQIEEPDNEATPKRRPLQQQTGEKEKEARSVNSKDMGNETSPQRRPLQQQTEKEEEEARSPQRRPHEVFKEMRALQEDNRQLRQLLLQEASSIPSSTGSTGSGAEDPQMRLLQREIHQLRADASEMETGFHEAATEIERECGERMNALECQLAEANAATKEAQADAASFAQGLADHLSASPSAPSAASDKATREAQQQAAAAWQEVQWLSQQLSELQGEAGPDTDAASRSASDEGGASSDPLQGSRANGTSRGRPDVKGGGGGASWLHDSRWMSLRRRGTSAGWIIDPSQVQLGAVLGQGSFGTTYRARWRGAECAVKVVRISKSDEANSFLREAEALSLLRHPNIMPFYGAVLQPPARCWLVCEYMQGGTVADWLYGTHVDPRASNGALLRPKRTLSQRIDVALSVARAMTALEGSSPPLVHRDIKPGNIFIDSGGAARLADLGLARKLTSGCSATLTGETGTYVYMAPEVIRHEVYDTSADVYSWGVLLVELLAMKPPYSEQYLTPVQVAIAVGDDKLRPLLPRGTHPSLAAIARAALEGEPSLRPSFASLVEQLTPLAAEIAGTDATSSAAAASASPGGMFGRLFKPQ